MDREVVINVIYRAAMVDSFTHLVECRDGVVGPVQMGFVDYGRENAFPNQGELGNMCGEIVSES